ncbi:MAG: hypothetical protein WCX15_02250 [Bacilli bacterium]|jgi:hypothetical protein
MNLKGMLITSVVVLLFFSLCSIRFDKLEYNQEKSQTFVVNVK